MPDRKPSNSINYKDAGVDIFHASTRRFWIPEFEESDLNLAGWTRKVTGAPEVAASASRSWTTWSREPSRAV